MLPLSLFPANCRINSYFDHCCQFWQFKVYIIKHSYRMNKNLPTKEDEEAELDLILRQTFSGGDYFDEEIGHLLKRNEPTLNDYLLNENKPKSIQSKASSEASDYSPVYHEQFRMLESEEELQSFHKDEQEQKVEEQKILQEENGFVEINKRIRSLTKHYTLEEVKESYENFIISQPTYSHSKTSKETISTYSASLKNINIETVDIGYCRTTDHYLIAMGSDDGRVAIFEQRSTKPIIFYEFFPKDRKILTLKWSQNQRYLLVCSDKKQLKAYEFKQPIEIESRIILRMKPKPVQLFSLTSKVLPNCVISICPIEEDPFYFLLLDQQSEIHALQWKKHIFNFRPYVTQALPIKFVNAFQIKTMTTKIQQIDVTLLAVGSDDYVTITMLKPEFQLILVYDKEKHGHGMKKQGYPFIEFRANPLGLLIIWGKYAEILNIMIQEIKPLKYRINEHGYSLFPQNTILGGFITNTLIYQLSHLGIKIYPTHSFLSKKQVQKVPPEPIYSFMIKFFELPSGLQIQDQITNVPVNIAILRMLQSIIFPVKGELVVIFNTSMMRIKVQDFQDCIHNTIENLNDWKVGLQLLYDSYRGQIKNYDRITKDVIIKNVKEYAFRYIGFLKGVIGGDGQIDFVRQKALWDQEIVFIFNLLIETHQFTFLLTKILNKLVDEGLAPLINNLEPFIFLNRLPILNDNGLRIIFDHIHNPKRLIGRLLVHLEPQQNEIDLPHTINQLLLNHNCYLQLILVNNLFGDFYTPFAVLASKYEQLQSDEQNNEQVEKITQFISFAMLRTFKIINDKEEIEPFPQLKKSKKIYILQNLLPLFQSTLIPIFLHHNPKIFFRQIIPQLYMDICLELLNTISNKRTNMNKDLMTNIVSNIPITIISDQNEYWMCILNLYNKKVVQLHIFMGLQHLTRSFISEGFIQETVEKSERQIIKQLSQLSDQTLTKYFHQLEHSSYISLIRVIGTIINKYIEVIHTLISSPFYRNERLYAYVLTHIDSFTPQQMDNLKQIIMYNLQMLVDIDPKSITHIIYKFYFPHIETFGKIQIEKMLSLKLTRCLIDRLQSDPEFDPEKHNQLITYLRLKYLRLLALTDQQHQILNELKQQQYPLDQSLQICEQYQVLDAQAYLLVKSGGQGDILSAIKLYFKLLLEKSSSVTLENIGNYQRHFLKILTECISICKKLPSESVQEWFLLVQEIKYFKQLLQTTVSAYIEDLLCQMIDQQAYPLVMKDLVLNAGLVAVSAYVQGSLKDLQLVALRSLIYEVEKCYTYEKVMLKLCQQTYIDDEQSNRMTIMQKVMQGFATNAVCDYCKERGMDLGVLVHYHCGHEIHPHCGNDVKVCVLCYERQSNIFNRNLDNMLKIKTLMHSAPIFEDQGDRKDKKSLTLKLIEYEDYAKSNDMFIQQLI